MIGPMTNTPNPRPRRPVLVSMGIAEPVLVTRLEQIEGLDLSDLPEEATTLLNGLLVTEALPRGVWLLPHPDREA